MVEAFDPYRKWLGILAAEQPTIHYRLLGITPFEDDPDVIESAADQRMSHVRAFQSGAHSAASQRILNELAAARLCLLNPASRQGYDGEMRRRVVPARVIVAVADPAPATTFTDEPPPRAGRTHKHRSSQGWLMLAAVAIPAAIVVGYVMYSRGGQAMAVAQPKESPPAQQNPSPAGRNPPSAEEPPVPAEQNPAPAREVAQPAEPASPKLEPAPETLKEADPPTLAQQEPAADSSRRFPCENTEPRSDYQWSIDGDTLLQASSRRDGNALCFGEADWGDYDFSVEASRIVGNDAFGLRFGRLSDAEYLIFALGGVGNSVCDVTENKPTGPVRRGAKPLSLNQGQWYRAEVRVRGQNCQCFLDGEKLFEFDVDRKLSGRIGLWTWGASYRFRNIVVKSPDGKVLLQGLPDVEHVSASPKLAASDPQPVSEKAKSHGTSKRFDFSIPDPQRGKWSIDGNELVQSSPEHNAMIVFGQPDWHDFDFLVEVQPINRIEGCCLLLRYQNDRNRYGVSFGGWGNTAHNASVWQDGRVKDLAYAKGALRTGEWHRLELKMRGSNAKCFLDGAQVMVFDMDRQTEGRLGLYTFAAYRFRNIVVKSPGGDVLLEGLPALDAGPSPNLRGAGTKRTRATPAGKAGRAADADRAGSGKLTATEAFSLKRHEAAVTRVAFHPTLPLLASAGKDGRALLWNLQPHTLPKELHKFGEEVWAVKFHPGGDYLAFANRNWWGSRLIIKTLAGQQLNEIKDFKNPGGEVTTIAYSHDGRLLAAGQINGTIRLWDTAQFREIPPVAFGDNHNVIALAFGAATVDRKSKTTQYLLAAGCQDGVARTLAATLDNKSGQWAFVQTAVSFPKGGPVIGVRFSADGKLLGITRLGGSIGLCNPRTGEGIRELAPGARVNPAEWIAFHPKRPWCVTAHKNEQVARIWNTETAELLCELKGHTAGVMCAEFSPDGRHVATASEDLSVKLWNLAGPGVPAAADRRYKAKPSLPIVGD